LNFFEELAVYVKLLLNIVGKNLFSAFHKVVRQVFESEVGIGRIDIFWCQVSLGFVYQKL